MRYSASAGREADLQALFDDYVRHENETIALSADGFHTELPVRLMDEAARKRFRDSVRFGHLKDPAAGAEFDSSAGMHRFSQFDFNPTHTLAIGRFRHGLRRRLRRVEVGRARTQRRALGSASLGAFVRDLIGVSGETAGISR